jgi:hypothetical protein
VAWKGKPRGIFGGGLARRRHRYEEFCAAQARDYLPKREHSIANRNGILCAALMHSVKMALRMGSMSGTSHRAKRYCDRANECLQVFATSQTPGTGEIYLLIAEHYLLLAASEKGKELRQTRASSPHAVA